MNPAYKLMIIAWIAVAIWVAFVIFTNRKVHPKALFALFMVELWERFSYYGMRAILVLYMASDLLSDNPGFGFSDGKAYGIYAAYGALVYLTPILGGYFADKMMGFRRAITWGALLMAAGQFTLFMNNQTTFFIGLALLVIGNGFFKPNISSMIGKFYPQGDPRRDGAFTIFYMGINIGAFLTPLTCGAIGEIEGWKYGFLTAGIGMLLGYVIFYWARNKGWFEEYGLPPEEAKDFKMLGMGAKILPYVATVVMIPLAWLLIINNEIVDIILAIVAVGILAYLLFITAPKYDKEQKQRIWVIVILLLFTTIFWTFFELAGSAMNLFTLRNINKTIFDFEFTTTFFQSINPLFIMIFAPVYSWMWIKLANSGKEPAAPYKFGVGLILLGSGFMALNLGQPAAVAGLVPAFFLIMLYLLHTLGELALSPVGLSLVTKLSPAKIVGMLMGIWFLSSSIAHQGGKHIAKLTSVDEGKIIAEESFQSNMTDKLVAEAVKTDFFQNWLKDNSGAKDEPCKEFDEGSVEFTLCNNKQSLDESLIHPLFVDYLNEKAGATKYFISKLQIQELIDKANKIRADKAREKEMGKSYVTFLSTTPDYPVDAPKILMKAEVNEITNNSVTGEVISSLRQDTLKIGLGVFRWLGIIAIGCGLLLFLIGPVISRWMHGIK
jgi:POT family proton-dependent oligopeptide transporter